MALAKKSKTRLTARERKIIELRLDPRLGLKEIGEQVGMDTSVVCRQLQKPHVQEELKRRTADVLDQAHQRLREVVPHLLEDEIQIASGKVKADRERLRALKTVLDRAGLAPTEHVTLGGGLEVRNDYADTAAAIREKLRQRSA